MAPKAPSKKSESTKAKGGSKSPIKYTTKDNTHNLLFLWACFQSTPDKTINFKAVADAYGINVSAARMRYARLKTLIEKISLPGNDEQDADAEAMESSEVEEPSMDLNKE